MKNPMLTIRKIAKTEEIDYLLVMEALKEYRQPRDKITKLLKQKELIRVKKGLYVFGKEYQRRPVSLEVLANLIYGPSYISYEYALSFYGLIPEKVVQITSACYKRERSYQTPLGAFVYHFLSPKRYAIGTTWKSIDPHTHYLIATKEKAIADMVAKMSPFKDEKDLFTYLEEGLRIDSSDLVALDSHLLSEIATVYKKKNVTLLWKAIL